MLALDRDHRAVLERVLDRCADMSSGYVDDLGALTTALSEEASLAEDVEAEREDRRSRQGYVEPRAARAFLALARQAPTAGAAAHERDAIARAYFRELAPPAASTAPEMSADTRALLGAGGATRPDLVAAMLLLREEDAALADQRLAELAFLANVLVAGGEASGRRLRPAEGAEAALATVTLGATLVARELRPSRGSATAEELLAVLRAHPADLLFRRASHELAATDTEAGRRGYVLSALDLAALD